MRKIFLPIVAAGLLLIGALSCSAQDKGYWKAATGNARTITGDIAISDFKLTIDFFPFTIAQIREIKPEEAAAAFNADGQPGAGGYLYRLEVPADRRFLHKNTLCGSDETQWMATYAAGNGLQVAFFSGAKQPVFTSEALANSTSLCGLFSYVR